MKQFQFVKLPTDTDSMTETESVSSRSQGHSYEVRWIMEGIARIITVICVHIFVKENSGTLIIATIILFN